MPWEMNGDQIVVEDGNPVWIADDGKKSPFDAGGVLKRLSDVTGESMGRKNKIRELEGQLEPFKDLDSDFVTKAKKAMDTVKNLNDKQLVDAGQVAEIKKDLEDQLIETKKSHAAELEGLKKQIDDKDAAIQRREVKGFFDQSEFIREKTVLTPTFAYDHFNRFFKTEEKDGDLIVFAERKGGEKIFSKDPKRAGKYATPAEAIEILIDEHPDKESILRGGTPGSGSPPPGGHNQDLSKLNPTERINAARGVN